MIEIGDEVISYPVDPDVPKPFEGVITGMHYFQLRLVFCHGLILSMPVTGWCRHDHLNIVWPYVRRCWGKFEASLP